MIFQSFNLLPALTVAENIILSMDASGKTFDRPKKQIAAELIEKVRLQPEYLNERILHLSGGGQQRVAIARALSYDHRLSWPTNPPATSTSPRRMTSWGFSRIWRMRRASA